ncbi:MAG: hypothetical protein J5I59_10355 [Saprospiraceae bacterium]|nr:hypothetical protein [Saprospiraceae bacterium]
MVYKFFPLVFFSILFLSYGCYNDDIETLSAVSSCDTTDMTFEKDIMPIISTSCALSGCHNAQSVLTFSLTNYEEVLPIVLDGRLVKAIKHQPGIFPMPKNTAMLDECTINKIESWIRDGAANN